MSVCKFLADIEASVEPVPRLRYPDSLLASPKILGEEFVGVVEDAGSKTKFMTGDHVAGWIYGGGKAHDGAYAEYVTCHSRRCFRLPQTFLSWSTLGGIFMSMWTAYGSLFEAGQITPTSTVLVHSGTSSVALWAILLARDRGCTVVATTRKKEKTKKLREAGADYVLLEEGLNDSLSELSPKGVNCILELVGPDKLMSFSLPHLAMHGSVVVTGVLTKAWTMDGFSPAAIHPTRKITFYSMTNSGVGQEDEGLEKVEGVMEEVVRKVENGTFAKDVFMDRDFELKDVGKAHEWMEENRAIGKVVVTVS